MKQETSMFLPMCYFYMSMLAQELLAEISDSETKPFRTMSTKGEEKVKGGVHDV